MLFIELCRLYNKLENFTERHTKTYLLANFLKEVASEDPELLKEVVKLLEANVEFYSKELGLGEKLIMRAMAKAYGVNIELIEQRFKELGDLGEVAQDLSRKGSKVSKFFEEDLTIAKVIETFKKISSLEGPGSQEKKILLFSSLLSDAKPLEAKYLIRIALGTLRLGIAEGTIRDAIAKAFNIKEELVERALLLCSDLPTIAYIAATKGEEGIKKIKPEIGKPIKMMLALLAPSIEQALVEFGGQLQAEYKYDGFRVQIHRNKDQVVIFSRNLEDVTKQFPEIVDEALSLAEDRFIIEGEVVAIESLDSDKPRPFQYISRRIKRKYDIDKMVQEIPVRLYAFDILYLKNEPLLDKALKERRALLEELLKEPRDHITLSKKLVTSSPKEIREFFNEAIALGHEGLMLKNLNEPYKPGKRVGTWYKLKQNIDTIDAVIVEAEWGEGKRSRYLSTFLIAVRHGDDLVPIGKVGSGLTDQMLEELTSRLKELIVKEQGKKVIVEPRVVVEVMFQEIQKSPSYESGFALRFPRIIRIRYDKGPEDIDTLDRIKELYEKQFTLQT